MKKVLLNVNALCVIFSCFVMLFQYIPLQAKESAVYANKDLNFSIEYPKDWIQGPNYGPDNVLSVISPNKTPDLNVTVSGSNMSGKLKNAPEEWANMIKMFIPGTRNFKILMKKSITLNDGTKAIKAKISWRMQNRNIVTSFLAINKNNKRIRVTSSSNDQIPFDVKEGIIDSFRFNK